MKLHRFYAPNTKLTHDFWLHDPDMLHQWNKVLRFRPGRQIVLFDGTKHERLYEITELSKTEAHLRMVTELQPTKPQKEIYLLWSLLKKDKNDWVLQKATELGASQFIPLLADRSEKTGFNSDRAKKIVIEAAEQCGRSNIPAVRGPLHVETALHQLKDKLPLYICEQGSEDSAEANENSAGLLIGPEGGWSDAEKTLFKQNNVKHLHLHDFTLRAETAAVVAITYLNRK